MALICESLVMWFNSLDIFTWSAKEQHFDLNYFKWYLTMSVFNNYHNSLKFLAEDYIRFKANIDFHRHDNLTQSIAYSINLFLASLFSKSPYFSVYRSRIEFQSNRAIFFVIFSASSFPSLQNSFAYYCCRCGNDSLAKQ
jgi:hypothetical protein